MCYQAFPLSRWRHGTQRTVKMALSGDHWFADSDSWLVGRWLAEEKRRASPPDQHPIGLGLAILSRYQTRLCIVSGCRHGSAARYSLLVTRWLWALGPASDQFSGVPSFSLSERMQTADGGEREGSDCMYVFSFSLCYSRLISHKQCKYIWMAAPPSSSFMELPL